jgi:hypothetical protein
LNSQKRYLSKLEELEIGATYIIKEHGTYFFKGISPPGKIPLTNFPSYLFGVYHLGGGIANSPSHGRELVMGEGHLINLLKDHKVRCATEIEYVKELLCSDDKIRDR